jgi:hypothetical protein
MVRRSRCAEGTMQQAQVCDHERANVHGKVTEEIVAAITAHGLPSPLNLPPNANSCSIT